MNKYTIENINNSDSILYDNFFFDKAKFSVFLNNVYKIGKSDNYEILLSWKDKDPFSMLTVYSVFLLYSFMYDKKLLYANFNIMEAIKKIYSDMMECDTLSTIKSIKENYIMKVLAQVILSNKKEKKENTMTLRNYLQKRLSISDKEAQLVESIAKDYLKKKSPLKEFSNFIFPLKDVIKKYSNKIKNGEKMEDFFYKIDALPENENNNIKSMYDDFTAMYGEYTELYAELLDSFTTASVIRSNKKESKPSLKSYLQKKLTINLEEAILIESVVKNYVKKTRS
jgi:hypothetical protein